MQRCVKNVPIQDQRPAKGINSGRETPILPYNRFKNASAFSNCGNNFSSA